MNKITVKIEGQEKLAANFAKAAGDARSRIKRAIQMLGFGLVGKIQREYLSGQRLNRRTGRLSGSIHEETTDTGGEVTTQVGTNVVYARPHEYGFSGSVAVKAHMREIKMAWGRSIAPMPVHVRGHNRRVDITEKRFMRDALAAYKPTIEATLTRVAEAIAKDAVK
jgi:phage gpG-like protein